MAGRAIKIRTVNSMTQMDTEVGKIPLWKLIDANYVIQDDDYLHHNGFIFKYESTEFSLTSSTTIDIYEVPVRGTFSSLTYAAYLIPSVGSPYVRLSRVEEITAAGQTKIDMGKLYVSVALGATLSDIAFSPSDYTRIDSGTSLRLGMMAGDNVIEGCEYSNSICIGYMADDATDGGLYDDDGQIISPGHEDRTVSVLGAYYYLTAPAVNEEPALCSDLFLKKHRICMSEREVGRCRFRMLSHLGLVRLGDQSGNGHATREFSYLRATQVVNATASWTDPRKIDVEFRSTSSGAYLKITNNNSFDVFIFSAEIWGLWVLKQSETGDFGGAIYHASYSEHNKGASDGVNIDNEFIQTADQAKNVADYYLELGTKQRHKITGIHTSLGRFLEIGDVFEVNMPEISSSNVKILVIGKSYNEDGVKINGRIVVD
jgi:hypothetical protein